jgi:hypothetical protein
MPPQRIACAPGRCGARRKAARRPLTRTTGGADWRASWRPRCGRRTDRRVAPRIGLRPPRSTRPSGGAEDAGRCRHLRPGPPHRPASVRTFRRHVPARHDRLRTDLPPHYPHRGRAQHGARRHHPGADSRPASASCHRATHRGGGDHPRHGRSRRHRRPRGRHVRRTHCRVRSDGGNLRGSAPPLFRATLIRRCYWPPFRGFPTLRNRSSPPSKVACLHRPSTARAAASPTAVRAPMLTACHHAEAMA